MVPARDAAGAGFRPGCSRAGWRLTAASTGCWARSAPAFPAARRGTPVGLPWLERLIRSGAGRRRGGRGGVPDRIRPLLDRAFRDRLGSRAGRDHRGARVGADCGRVGDLGPDRRVDRVATAHRRQGSADRPVPRRLPGQSVLSAGGRADPAFPAQHRDLAEPPDDPRHAVVHRLQRDRRRDGPARGVEAGGDQSRGPALAVVAADHAAGDLSGLCHRGGHGGRRFVECEHRLRGRAVGRHDLARHRHRGLYRPVHGRWRRRPYRAGHRRVVFYVLAFNRLLWRRLYNLAAERLRLD